MNAASFGITPDDNGPFKVYQINNADPTVRVVFTWDDAIENCDYVAMGADDMDDTVDAMVAAKAHEGASFPGWTTVLA